MEPYDERRQERMRGAGTHAIDPRLLDWPAASPSTTTLNETPSAEATSIWGSAARPTMDERRFERVRGAGTHAVDPRLVNFPTPSPWSTSMQTRQTPSRMASAVGNLVIPPFGGGRREERMRGAGTHAIDPRLVNFPTPSPSSTSMQTRQTPSSMASAVGNLVIPPFGGGRREEWMRGAGTHVIQPQQAGFASPSIAYTTPGAASHHQQQQQHPGQWAAYSDRNATPTGSAASSVAKSFAAPMPGRRKVGRPRKVRPEETNPGEPIVKKKRGRPRKEQTLEKIVEAQQKPEVTKPGEPIPKKKTGRPRKEPTLEKIVEAQQKQEKRERRARRVERELLKNVRGRPVIPMDVFDDRLADLSVQEREKLKMPRRRRKRDDGQQTEMDRRQEEKEKKKKNRRQAMIRRRQKRLRALEPAAALPPLFVVPPRERKVSAVDRREFQDMISLALDDLPHTVTPPSKLTDVDVLYHFIKRHFRKVARSNAKWYAYAKGYAGFFDAILARLIVTFRKLSKQAIERRRLITQLLASHTRTIKLRKLAFQKRAHVLRVIRSIDAFYQEQVKSQDKSTHETAITDFLTNLRSSSKAWTGRVDKVSLVDDDDGEKEEQSRVAERE